jgi:hypothetical protein
MADGFIVRRGGKAEVIEKAETPTINFVSSTTTSITFTIKNNDAQTAVILWEQNDTTPDANTLELAAGATSSNLTISGFTEGTLLTIYATANVTDKIKSNVAELVRGTTLATPTITQVSKTTSSITFTVRNNSNQAADVTYGLTSPPTTTTLALNANTTSANQTISGLADNTQFTVFAQTKKANHTDSAIASSTVTTDELIIFTAATGGTTNEYDSGGKRFKSHTFTSDNDFIVTTVGNSDRNKVDFLVIAGGASGGGTGGGGGAGGYRTSLGNTGGGGTTQSPITVTAKTYGIVVGAGGAAITARSQQGNNGTSSTFDTVTTVGGGRSANNNTTNRNGFAGGSGGGGGSSGTLTTSGGAGTANEGFAGGGNAGFIGDPFPAGGGGGASQVGSNASSNSVSGKGGNGLANLLRTGSNETRGGGGGGGLFFSGTVGSGGTGGGGTGGHPSLNPTAGAVNTGGGGGGVDYENNTNSVAGGSGIVVIRYEIAPSV